MKIGGTGLAVNMVNRRDMDGRSLILLYVNIRHLVSVIFDWALVV